MSIWLDFDGALNIQIPLYVPSGNGHILSIRSWHFRLLPSQFPRLRECDLMPPGRVFMSCPILSMIATHTPFIIPTRMEWLLLFLMVGIFGFIAQACIFYSFFCLTYFHVAGIFGDGSATRNGWTGVDGGIYSSMYFSQLLFNRCCNNTFLSQVIFAVILEQIFFKPVPSILSLIGTLIIMSSALYVAVSIFPIIQLILTTHNGDLTLR